MQVSPGSYSGITDGFAFDRVPLSGRTVTSRLRTAWAGSLHKAMAVPRFLKVGRRIRWLPFHQRYRQISPSPVSAYVAGENVEPPPSGSSYPLADDSALQGNYAPINSLSNCSRADTGFGRDCAQVVVACDFKISGLPDEGSQGSGLGCGNNVVGLVASL